MPDYPIKIQKDFVHFRSNVEKEPGVFKDQFSFGFKLTAPEYAWLPTWGIQIEVDVGTQITPQMLNAELQTKITEILANCNLDQAARQKVRNVSGVTEDGDWFYATVSV